MVQRCGLADGEDELKDADTGINHVLKITQNRRPVRTFDFTYQGLPLENYRMKVRGNLLHELRGLSRICNKVEVAELFH